MLHMFEPDRYGYDTDIGELHSHADILADSSLMLCLTLSCSHSL